MRVQERTAELTAKNEQLRESEQRYRSVIQDHLEFIIRWRDDGVRTFVNDSYCRYCEAIARGADRHELHVVDRRGRPKKCCKKSWRRCRSRSPWSCIEHRVVTPDGRIVWEHWTHRALFNQQGKLIEFQSVGCDVTERRKREEHAAERARSHRTDCATLTDREHDVMRLVVAGDANKVMARKLGLSIKTIEKHRSSLMKKLHVRSVPELVRLALLIEELRASA